MRGLAYGFMCANSNRGDAMTVVRKDFYIGRIEC